MRRRTIFAKMARTLRRAFVLVVAMALMGSALSGAPASQQTNPYQMGQRPPSPFDRPDDMKPTLTQSQLQAINAERQKSMVSDTEKLLKLARELNAEVAAGTANSLTAGQLRKVAEIEKLAHNVKKKMAYSVGGGPVAPDPFARPLR